MVRFRALVVFAIKAEALAFSSPHGDVLAEQANLGLRGRPHLVVTLLAVLQIRRSHQTDVLIVSILITDVYYLQLTVS
jgi:hypothetical protein